MQIQCHANIFVPFFKVLLYFAIKDILIYWYYLLANIAYTFLLRIAWRYPLL